MMVVGLNYGLQQNWGVSISLWVAADYATAKLRLISLSSRISVDFICKKLNMFLPFNLTGTH